MSAWENITHDFQKEYGMDVAKSLKKMEAIDFVVEELIQLVSKETDVMEKKTEQESYDMWYQEEYSQHLDQKKMFN